MLKKPSWPLKNLSHKGANGSGPFAKNMNAIFGGDVVT